MADKAKPAHKIRHRALTVTIWKNTNDKGSWYSVTPSRAYKQGEEWKESDRFDSDDLLPLAKLLDQAHTWIVNAEQTERQAAERVVIVSALLYERLLNEATRYGTAEILRRMPAAYSQELEQAIRQGVHEAVLYYAEKWDALSGQPLSVECGKTRL